jgi:hypothetical protein
MPIAFHLKISRSAAHAGETSRRVLRVKRVNHQKMVAEKPAVLLLPASPRDEPVMPPTPIEPTTPRPTLDLDAPKAQRPLTEAPNDVDYDAFGGVSPGFCPTGDCRCGRCGYDRYGSGGDRYWSSSRYGYGDYAQDYTEEEDEWDPYGDDGYVIPAYVPSVDPYEEAKGRICKEIGALIKEVGAVTGWEERERAAIRLIEYMLTAPFVAEFLERNAHFKSVVGAKMTEFSVGGRLPELRRACGEVLGRFY